MDDAQIIKLFLERNEEAINELDNKYGRLCHKIANNFLHNTQDSEECVNDTYLNIWNKIPPTKPANLCAFVCKIVRNLSLKKLEYANAKKRSAENIIPLHELENTIADENIAQDISDEDLGKIISSFLYTQKEIQRNVFLRRYFFFDSINDIATKYDFSESKVKSMLFHTKKKLKTYLEKEGIYI